MENLKNMKLSDISMKNDKRKSLFQISSFIGKQLIMVTMALILLYPLFFVLMTSFKTNTEVIKYPFQFTSFQINNYVVAWRLGKVGKYLFNSVIVTSVSLVFQLALIVLTSYSLGRLKPWGYNTIIIIYLSAMFVTTEITTIPVFMLLKNINLINTRWSLILPYTAMGLVFPIYITTNYISGLPKEIEEAAIIDGCGVFQTLFRVDLPLITPILATVIIINFQAVWSEFYWALIAVKDELIKTLPLGLINFQAQYSSNYSILSAGLVILTIPILIIYLSASRYFVEGITMGSVKG